MKRKQKGTFLPEWQKVPSSHLKMCMRILSVMSHFCLRMFFPPEVLEHICSQLSQATLRHCASLVSRQWYLVCRVFIHRPSLWKVMGDRDQAELLEKIKAFRVDTLCCYLLIDPDLHMDMGPVISPEQHRPAWRSFMRAMMKPKRQLVVQDGINLPAIPSCRRPPDCLMDHIRHFVFRGYRMNFQKVLEPLLPYLSCVRSLTLDYRDEGRSVALFRILDMCMCLEELSIQGPYFHSVTILDNNSNCHESEALDNGDIEYYSNEDYLIDSRARTAATIAKISAQHSRRYRLSSVVITRATIPPCILERLIVACPDLRILKARSINKSNWFGTTGIQGSDQSGGEASQYHEHLSKRHLMELARDCSPNLEWIHLMRQSGDELDTLHLGQINQVFLQSRGEDSATSTSLPSAGSMTTTITTSPSPCSSQVTMLCSHMPSRWTLSIQRLFSQITALEIFPNPLDPFDSACLNNILCQMPSLLHLDGSLVDFSTKELWLVEPATTSNAFNGNNIPSVLSQTVQVGQVTSNSGKRLARYLKRFDRDEKMAARKRVNLPTAFLPVPKAWQCRGLTTLRIGLLASLTSIDTTAFFQYLVANCPNIQHLSLTGVPELYVGQRLPILTGVTVRAGRRPNTTSSSTGQGRLSTKAPSQLQVLQELRGLRSLDIFVRTVPGFVEKTDFRFLRKRAKATIWPSMESLMIRYIDSPLTTSFSTILDELHDMRPSMEVRFRHELRHRRNP